MDKKATRSKVISHFENQQAIICRLKVDQEPFLHTCIGIHTRVHLGFEFVCTLISLITVEVGINVEGVQKLQKQ